MPRFDCIRCNVIIPNMIGLGCTRVGWESVVMGVNLYEGNVSGWGQHLVLDD